VSSTDKIRTALIATLSYEEREATIARLGTWFETNSTLEEEEFDEMLEAARGDTLRRQEEEQIKWSELEKTGSAEDGDLATGMADAPSVDPKWEEHHAANLKYGIAWGGAADPRHRCASHILMSGDSHRCDGTDLHQGWAHWNRDLGVMWQ
jgi:hypothetical protein